MTSPSWPVISRPPFPFIRVASMNRMSPPDEVQARPVATPTSSVLSATSGMKTTGPRCSCRLSGVMERGLVCPMAIAFATLRQMVAICCSSFRSPESEV